MFGLHAKVSWPESAKLKERVAFILYIFRQRWRSGFFSYCVRLKTQFLASPIDRVILTGDRHARAYNWWKMTF